MHRKPQEELPSIDASLLAWRGVLDETCAPEDAITYEELNSDYGRTRFDRGWVPFAVRLAAYYVVFREPSGLLLELVFEVTATRGDEWGQVGEQFEEVVRLESQSCHYGGVRWWFRCDGCGRLRARLYLPLERFACRECHGLTYKLRSRYGAATRRGGGRRVLSLIVDLEDGIVDRQVRRNWRRRLSRWRRECRDNTEMSAAIPIQLGLPDNR